MSRIVGQMIVKADPRCTYTRRELISAVRREMEKIKAHWKPGGLYFGLRSMNEKVALLVVFAGGEHPDEGLYVLPVEEAYERIEQARQMTGGVFMDHAGTHDLLRDRFGEGKVQ